MIEFLIKLKITNPIGSLFLFVMDSNISTIFFGRYIHFISPAFSVMDNKMFESFCSAIDNYTTFVFLFDNLLDGDIDWSLEIGKEDNCISNLFHNHQMAIMKLRTLFINKSKFWQTLEDQESAFSSCLIKEKILDNKKLPISLHDFEDIAFGKHCLALVPLVGLAELFPIKADKSLLQKMLVDIYCGMQMLDDIEDFTNDNTKGRWNFIQSEVSRVQAKEKIVNTGIHKFHLKILYVTGLYSDNMKYALNKFNDAYQKAAVCQLGDLARWLHQMQKNIQEKIDFAQSKLAKTC